MSGQLCWLGWTEAAALTWLSLLTELGQQETKRWEAWGLEGGTLVRCLLGS